MDYYTTALCKANIPADIIKDIVGWESTNMVSLYNDTEVDEELGKYFDEARPHTRDFSHELGRLYIC